MTDQEAFGKLKEGNSQALAYIYEKNRNKCILFAIKNLYHTSLLGKSQKCTPEEGLELYHEAIIALHENIRNKRLTELHVKFSTYIISTMKFKWLNKKRPNEIPLDINLNLTEEKDDKVEAIQEKVRAVIARLDEKCREMLTLRYFLGWDYEDISGTMGYNKGDVVRNLISRCRSKFRKLMADRPNVYGRV